MSRVTILHITSLMHELPRKSLLPSLYDLKQKNSQAFHVGLAACRVGNSVEVWESRHMSEWTLTSLTSTTSIGRALQVFQLPRPSHLPTWLGYTSLWLAGERSVGIRMDFVGPVTLVYGRENGHTNHTVCWNDLAGKPASHFSSFSSFCLYNFLLIWLPF